MDKTKPPRPRAARPDRDMAIVTGFTIGEHDMPIEIPEDGRLAAPTIRQSRADRGQRKKD
jgi:hypothetical protein